VPVAAAGLADVGAGDAQPLVLGGRGQHPPQQLTIARLDLGLPGERGPGGGDPRRERVAHLLQLPEAGDPRLPEARGNPGVEREPGEGLGREARELVLEAADLAAQLGAREALVAPYSKRAERVSIEQIRHRTFRV
jgi:hypothetical protein